MVIALIALFVSLGGVSYGVVSGSIDGREVKNGSLTGRDIKNGSLDGDRELGRGSVSGSRVDESSLGRVPRAQRADSAAAADTATQAGRASSAASADTANRARSADNSANADKLGGLPPSAFASGVALWAVVDGTQPADEPPLLIRSSGDVSVVRDERWDRGGAYKVTFPRSVRNCVYMVTPGQVDLTPDRQRLTMRVSAEPNGANENTVDVFLEDVIPDVNDDGTFGLTVLC